MATIASMTRLPARSTHRPATPHRSADHRAGREHGDEHEAGQGEGLAPAVQDTRCDIATEAVGAEPMPPRRPCKAGADELFSRIEAGEPGRGGRAHRHHGQQGASRHHQSPPSRGGAHKAESIVEATVGSTTRWNTSTAAVRLPFGSPTGR